MKITGNSKIDISKKVLDDVLNEIIDPSVVNNVELILDTRANVLSQFGKVTVENGISKISIYTGAIVNVWDISFTTADGLDSEEEVFMQVLLFLMIKALRKETFNLKVKEIQAITLTKDWADAKNSLVKVLDKYREKQGVVGLNV